MNTRRFLPLLVVTLLLSPLAARAQTGNPVYVDYSPVAWELLQLAREQAVKNEGEAVRLYGELLVEHGAALVPRQIASSDEFVSVRERALGDLSARQSLLRRYRLMFTAEAERRLAAGGLRDVALAMSLTEPGLRAMMKVAQQDLESARFRAALRWIEEALAHPDLDSARAAQCWFMSGLASHHLGQTTRLRQAQAALEALGPDGRSCRLELERLVTAGPGPDILRGATSLDRTQAMDLDELVAQTIWSAELTNSPLVRLFADPSPERTPRSAGFERKRRDGDLTTVTATIAGPTVYVNEGHTVRALDRFTGRSVWERPYRDNPRPVMTRRDDAHAGDLSVVAIEGDTLVTLTGHAYAAARSGGGKVLCLDARTGQRRWEVTLDRIGGERDHEGLFPYGAPVIAEERVYVLARKVSPQMLTGCYVVALDRVSGAVAWIRLIASSGSKTKTARPFSTLVHDDGDLFVATSVGAIASIDAARGLIQWLRRSSVPVHVRGRPRQPWEMGGAVVIGDRVIAITPDERKIVVLDRQTGDELESHDAQSRDTWGSPGYLLARDGWVYGIGNEVRAFVADRLERPLWRLPTPPESRISDLSDAEANALPDVPAVRTFLPETLTLVGRVQLATDALIVPTMSGVLVVESDTGRLVHRLKLESSGNPMAIGAQLLLAGPDSLKAYMSLARAEQMLRDRIAANPGDAEPALSLVQLGMRVRDLSLALEAAGLSLRAIDRAPGDPRPSTTRRELFNMLLEIHERRIAVTPDEHEALYGMIGTVAATAEQRAEYFLAYGDGLAGWAPDRAVETYQSVLSQPVLAATPRGESGTLRPAGIWAAERLGRLVEMHGDDLYAPQSDFARQSFEHLMATTPDDEAAFAALAVEFPYAEASIDAALRAARLRSERGDERAAIGVLAASFHLAPIAARRSRLLGAFVQTCLNAHGPAAAAAVLDEMAVTMEDPLLETAGGPRRASVWHAELTVDTTRSRQARIGVAHRGDEALVADPLPGTLLGGAWSASGGTRHDRVLLLVDDRLMMVRGGPRTDTPWAVRVDDPEVRLLDFGEQEILLWMGDDAGDPRVAALDPETGATRWSTPRLAEQLTPPLAQERGIEAQMPDGMPFNPGETLPLFDADSIYLVQRTGGVAAFDRAAAGAWRWSADRLLTQVHLARPHALGLVLVGMDRARSGGELQPTIVVLDQVTGQELYRLAPRSRTGVLWVVADAMGSLLCATPEGLELFDLAQGRRRWINVAYDALEAQGGWVADDRVIIESRTGSLYTIRLEDGRASGAFDTDIRGTWEREALRHLHVDGERILAQFRDRIVRYDLDGRVVGADIITDPRDYRWLLPAEGRLVVISQHDTRQVPVRGEPGRQTLRHYRIYVLSETCALDGAMMELKPITRRILNAAIIDGQLLLSTDSETLAVPLPVAEEG